MADIEEGQQYLRKAKLYILSAGATREDQAPSNPSIIDLSEFQFRFKTSQEDWESPSSCDIRIYNLSKQTMEKIQSEYIRVVLQAGYEKGPFGVIFDGTIKQFRRGRESNVNTYLDILAADGDIAYNWSLIQKSLAAGSSYSDRVREVAKAFAGNGASLGYAAYPDSGGILPRGKVLFGYAKAHMGELANSMGASWSIQNGKINVTPLDSYLPGEAVVLTAQTGMIGRPEQTQDGLKARTLLNPKLVCGGQVHIDNASINQTINQNPNSAPGPAYNQYAGVQQLASVTADGYYRIYVVEHEGNTRGLEWWSNIICLTINPVTKKTLPYGT